MDYRKLGNTGIKVSSLSFGASSLGSVFKKINKREGIRTVHEAINNGINYIDVSPYYGLSEAENVLGIAIKDINRDNFYLSTKVGRYGESEFDFSETRIFESVEESLKRLQTEYIDILYLHDIEFGNIRQIVNESIPAINKLKEQGKIRFTGISGLPLEAFRDVIDQEYVDLILSYCHYSLNDRTLLEFLPFFEKYNIGVVNASPLSMGLLRGGELPKWHPASKEMQQVCNEAYEFCKQQGEDLAKLAIQFSTSNINIPTTLVSTANVEKILKNIKWTEEPMNVQLLDQVTEILKPIMDLSWSSGNYKKIV